MCRYNFLLVLLLLALPMTAAAQQTASTLHGRHIVTLQMGLLNHATAETSVGVGNTDSRVNGFAGSFTYTYWVEPDWAALISLGMLDAEVGTSVNVGTVSTESAVVVPLLFGAKYSPVLARRPSVRPYLSGAVGPYVGSATATRAGFGVRNETITETAFGFRAMAGADWFVGRHAMIEFGAGYHFVSDFDEPIGSDKNYSGPEFSIGLGFVFGQGR